LAAMRLLWKELKQTVEPSSATVLAAVVAQRERFAGKRVGLVLTATFAPGAVTEESPGWFSTDATPLSITGNFSGLFTNTGTYAPGIYQFDFDFLDQSWAGNNGVGGPSYFGASAVAVPEPATLGLFGFGLMALGLCVRMRRRSLA
jgi:hypothetical protein